MITLQSILLAIVKADHYDLLQSTVTEEERPLVEHFLRYKRRAKVFGLVRTKQGKTFLVFASQPMFLLGIRVTERGFRAVNRVKELSGMYYPKTEELISFDEWIDEYPEFKNETISIKLAMISEKEAMRDMLMLCIPSVEKYIL